MTHHPSDHCTTAQAQLLDGAPLAPAQWQRLYRHLETCAACRAYRDLLDQFTTALTPDPQARPTAKIAQHINPQINSPSIWQRLNQALHRPVPAYRALLATAAAALLFVLLEQPQQTPSPPHQTETHFRAQVFAQVDSYQVLDQLRALEKRGRDHREDSLLFRHLVSGAAPTGFF